MFKTPPTGTFLVVLALLAAPWVAFADHPPEPGVHAFDSRSDAVINSDNAFAMPSAGGRPDLEPGGAPRAPGAEGDLSADSGALPLGQFARGEIKPAAPRGATGFVALVARVRDGGLPEPASWALMLIGFGMIGGALRGFVVANRRLAGLQPEDREPG